MPPSAGLRDSRKTSTGLQILQKITSALTQSGYEISQLKRRDAFITNLQCSKLDLCVGISFSAVEQENELFHCELDVWRFYSTFDRREVRRKKIEQDIDPLRELYCNIDQQIREVFAVDIVTWTGGAKGLQIIGSDGRPHPVAER